MSRTVQFIESLNTYLQEYSSDLIQYAKTLAINSNYTPTKVSESDTVYIDILPVAYHGETVEARRSVIKQEDVPIRILIRKKLSESTSKDNLNDLMALVECIGDLLLNTSFGDNTRCSPVDITYDEFAKVFSSTITVHIKSKFD